MNKQTIITQVILLTILVSVITLLIVFYDEGNEIGIKNILGLENEIKTNLGISSYKYNTICDVKSMPEGFNLAVIRIMFEIQGGMHNDNEYLIQFFKTDELMSRLGYTPNMVFGLENIYDDKINSFNQDPIFSDPTYFAPVILQIMDVNPKVIDMLMSIKERTPTEFFIDMQSELQKCQ